MGSRRWLAAILLATAVPARGAAQAVLPLDAAVGEALAHNASLTAARAGAAEAAAGADAAHAAYFPRFSFGESWQRGDQPVFVFSSLLSARRFAASNFAIDNLNHPDPLGFFRASFGVEQLVFDGGRTRATVSSAALRRDIADRSAAEAAANIALAATEAYGRLLIARTARRAADGAVAAGEEDYARAGRRRDAGTMSEADVLSLAVHLADVRQRQIRAGGDEAIARAELNRLMGAPIDREYDVVEPAIARGAAEGSLPALLAEAERARPELQRAEAAQRLAQAGVGAARAAWMPQVAAQAGYELAGTRFNERASAWVVGGELRWSFSAGGAENAGIRAARDGLTRAQADVESARGAVQVEVLSALRRLEAARARETVASSSVAQARESQRIVRDRFDAGLAGVSDVLRVAAAVLDAETQRVSTIVDAVVSDVMLRRAVGRTP